MKTRAPFIIAAFFLAASAWGASNFGGTETVTANLPIDAEGSVWIENPTGNIDIIGTDDDFISFLAQKIVHGIDGAAAAEAREQTQILTTGDERVRQFRTQLPPLRNTRWTSSVNFIIRLPRTVLVKIGSQSAEHIHIVGLTRSVTVKNTNGGVVLDNVTGSAVVQSVNGSIFFNPGTAPSGSTQLTTVNGQIDVYMPPEASFRWVAETIRGDFKTNFKSVSGRMQGTTFRGGVNGSRGPTITTSSLMGTVNMVRKGTNGLDVRSVRTYSTVAGTAAGPPALARIIQMPFVQGDFFYSTSLGSFDIGQVAGNAKIETGAGEVKLGIVKGECTLVSLGGPLTLGDVFGVLNARTKAGDVLINAARSGGFVSTGGGLIRILYGGGPLTLHSDGGDIIVRETSGSVAADTPSGDITINIDPGSRGVAIDAKTSEGNVTVNVGPRFAADIDAIVMTSDATANAIHTDFAGLTFRREQVGNKTRIRATGKVNGGGERVVLFAEEGDIHIGGQSSNPILSPAQ
jgi:DUF4097 and DUF4098 domain-containing protein YvlB